MKKNLDLLDAKRIVYARGLAKAQGIRASDEKVIGALIAHLSHEVIPDRVSIKHFERKRVRQLLQREYERGLGNSKLAILPLRAD